MIQKSPNQINTKSLTVKYAVLMAAYWGSCCCINGFASTFLLSRNFTNSAIGIVVAIGNILAVLTAPRIAAIADRSQKITIHHLVLIPAILFVVSVIALYFSGNVFPAVAAFFLFALGLLQLLQPLTNAVSVYYINHGVSINFGIPRAMGSLTWAILSTILGIVINHTGENAILFAATLTGLLMVVGIVVFPLIKKEIDALPETLSKEEAKSTLKEQNSKNTNTLDFIRNYPSFCVLLIGIMLIFVFQTISNNYLHQLSKAIGGDTTTLGYAFTVQALIELPPMILFVFLSKKFSSKSLMIFSFVFFVLKALGFAFVQAPVALYLVMVLQMPSYAVFIPTSINYVNDTMRDADKFRGQAMITAALTFGAVLGSLLGGAFIDAFGILHTQKIDFAICLVGAVVAISAMLKSNKKDA